MKLARPLLLLSTILVSGAAWSAHATEPDTTGIYAEFLDGHFAASIGDSDQSASDFLEAVTVDPSERALVRHAFEESLLAGRPEAMRLAARLPGDDTAEIALGVAAAEAGDWADAERRFGTLSKQGITGLIQPLLLAWADQGVGNTDGALTTLQPYVAGRQLPGFFALQAALIADMSGRTDLAASLYQAARVGNGTPPLRLAQVIASFDARTNHQAQALQTLDAVADAAPLLQLALPGMAAHLREPAVATPLQGVAETLVGFSAALHQDGDDRMSILMLRLALMVRPDLSAARLLAADVLESQQDLAGAIDVLAPVPESDALAPVVRVREAELTARNGQPDQALAMLSALASQIPDSSAPDSEAGDVLRMKGDWQGAIVAYSRAIARMGQPSAIDWPVFYDRGIAYSQTGDWAQAQADFEHALQLQPNQPLVLNYLGYSWADRGEHLAQARDMLETAAHLQPGDGEIIDSLGWVMLRQGDATQAVDMLERAAELEPADATINAHLGDAYWAAGRKTEAAYQWRRALIFNPPPADAAKIEAKLHDTTAQASTETPKLR